MSTTPSLASFAPAVKEQLRARVAFDGPTGSGKTWSMLAWATTLAAACRDAGGPGRIALIDTERRSASLYADHYAFDVMNWPPPYDPRVLTKVLRETEALGYDVIIVDSLTHFWKGEGGTLDIVDGVAARGNGNTYTAWAVGTPAIRGLVDTILAVDAHVLVSMRSKMEYVLETNSRGKQEPRKIGLAPEMRGDIEYEFTVVVSMDLDHRGVVGKTRCDLLDGMVIAPGPAATEDAAVTFAAWLNSGAAAVDYAAPDQVEAMRRWLNSLAAPRRKQVRDEWPLGVPLLNAPGITVDHLFHLTETVTRVTGEGPGEALAAALAGGELPPEDGPDEDPPPAPGDASQPGPDDGSDDGLEPQGEAAADMVTGNGTGALPLDEEDGLDDPSDPPTPPATDEEPQEAQDGAGDSDTAPTPPEGGDVDSEATPQPSEDPATDAPPDPEVEEARARRLEEVIAEVGRLTPRQVNDRLNERGAALGGNVHTLSARLVSAILNDEGIDITQVKVREHLTK